MTEPSATVVLDSISEAGTRLTTLVVVIHRFVLSEFNTHRKFSRNSASSRAIPVAKQMERVSTDPAIPLSWPAEQKGMQGGEELTGIARRDAIQTWLGAKDIAVMVAGQLTGIGVHKSIANRVLEPFMWQTIVVSATEWDNFFAQRCSPLAQPEIRAAAEAMLAALVASEPTLLRDEQWHTPFIQPDEYDVTNVAVRRKVSAARCARVSYLTHDGRRDLGEDLSLFERLATADPAHLSPLEHVARPARPGEAVDGNFDGWVQLRHALAVLPS